PRGARRDGPVDEDLDARELDPAGQLLVGQVREPLFRPDGVEPRLLPESLPFGIGEETVDVDELAAAHQLADRDDAALGEVPAGPLGIVDPLLAAERRAGRADDVVGGVLLDEPVRFAVLVSPEPAALGVGRVASYSRRL